MLAPIVETEPKALAVNLDQPLTPGAIHELGSQIAEQPVISEQLGNAWFTVYRTSNLYESGWNSEPLRKLTLAARRTYEEYGDVPPTDAYDEKSAVYLTRVNYPYLDGEKEIPAEEWLSMRFVPAAGEPPLTEDLHYMVITDREGSEPVLLSMVRSLAQLQGLSEDEQLASIVTHSRISAIRPYSTEDGFVGNGLFDSTGHPLRNNRYTGLAFALMNKAFFEDAKKDGYNFSTATALMHRVLTDQILTLHDQQPLITLPFCDAAAALNLPDGQTVELTKEVPGVRYRFPGYFLDRWDLVSFLQQGIIPTNILETHLVPEVKLEDVFTNPKMEHFRNFGPLIMTDGPIEGANITGEQLRHWLDRQVRDGPVLHIMHVPDWLQGVDSMIEYARQYRLIEDFQAPAPADNVIFAAP